MRKSYTPFNLLIQQIFWYLIPTVEVRLKWPVGYITVDHNHPKWDWSLGATLQEGFSADPNDHYRPWLEKNVGKQSIAWDWKIAGNDAADNMLTLRIRQDKAKYATIATMKWA